MNLAFRDDQQANAETHNQARASRLLQCKRHDQRLADWSQIRSLSDATAHGNQECIDIVSPFRLCQQHCDTGAESLSGLFEACQVQPEQCAEPRQDYAINQQL